MLNTIKFTMFFSTFQEVIHAFNKVINVEEFQLGTAVVDGKGLIVCHCPGGVCLGGG